MIVGDARSVKVTAKMTVEKRAGARPSSDRAVDAGEVLP